MNIDKFVSNTLDEIKSKINLGDGYSDEDKANLNTRFAIELADSKWCHVFLPNT